MALAPTQRISTRATGIVGVAILCSRVLGLIRELLFAGLFGAGRNLDAFLMAFRVPNMLRDLFAEGALSAAFITTAWRLANKVATLTAVFMSAVTLLGIVFAPQLIEVMTWWSWSPEKTELTILLTRIMWPFILMVSLAALVMGMLNAKQVFGPPAMASSFFNLGSIIGGVALGWWLDPQFGARSLIGLSIGTLIGGLWQLTAQFPSLRRVGYKYRPDFQWRDEGVRTVLGLMAPAVIAASVVQVNVLVNSGFAARLGDGPVSWLNIAFRLMQLPLGIFGVAVATVTLPLVSRSAAVGSRGHRPHHSGGADHSFDLRAWPIHAVRDNSNGGRITVLRHRPRRIFRGQSARASVLRFEQTLCADVRNVDFHHHKFFS